MALQNRVSPDGEIHAVAARGTMLGNRGGCHHDANKRLSGRRWVSRQWIVCRLQFKGRQREVMAPNRYTELFFLDEATAFAAGHRPCFECRREDALRFAELWAECDGETGRATAPAMDRVLHDERLDRDGGKRVTTAEIGTLPDGAFVRWHGQPHLVWLGWLLRWSFGGYQGRLKAPAGTLVEVLTPASICKVLRAGYWPQLHASADDMRLPD